MALPSVVVIRQLVRARFRQALMSAIAALALFVIALLAIGLAVAAGVIVTAERLGVVGALLAWSGGLLLVALLLIIVQLLARRRRRIRELERAASSPIGDPAATMLSDIGFRAGINAGNALPPLAALATAFVIGSLVARSRRRR